MRPTKPGYSQPYRSAQPGVQTRVASCWEDDLAAERQLLSPSPARLVRTSVGSCVALAHAHFSSNGRGGRIGEIRLPLRNTSPRSVVRTVPLPISGAVWVHLAKPQRRQYRESRLSWLRARHQLSSHAAGPLRQGRWLDSMKYSRPLQMRLLQHLPSVRLVSRRRDRKPASPQRGREDPENGSRTAPPLNPVL